MDDVAEAGGETLTIRTNLLAPSGVGRDRCSCRSGHDPHHQRPGGPRHRHRPDLRRRDHLPPDLHGGTAVDLTLPAATGGEGAITYTLTPAIPGLTLDATTGALTGMPTTAAAAADHTYTAGDTTRTTRPR